MEEKLEELEFWLPSEFLTDEDILMDHMKPTPPALRFTATFPFDFGSSGLSSPVGSTETESSDEEDAVLAELSRQLTLHGGPKLIPLPSNREKSKAASGSPQSTLTKVGSWSGRSTISSNGSSYGPSQVSSPPTSPLGLENDPWDLIYQAAGQIARLQITGANTPTPNPVVLGPPNRLPTSPPLKNTPAPMMNQDACGLWSRGTQNAWRFDSPEIYRVPGSGRAPQYAWPSQQRTQQHLGGGFGYGYGYGPGVGGPAGGGRAGTGVFLPRRYENNRPGDFRKKPVSTPAMHNTIKPANTWNNNNGAALHGKPGYAPNDTVSTMAARRNVAPVQQPSRFISPEEICLPQEWTY